MSQYIEREKIGLTNFEIILCKGSYKQALKMLLEQIESIPAANVRPVVRGKWIYDHWCEFKCSNCGAWSKSEPYRGRENFCPNCGADMR